MCEWGTGEQCVPSVGEGRSEHGHPPQAGGWRDGSVQVFQGDCSERERGKMHGVQQGKSL